MNLRIAEREGVDYLKRFRPRNGLLSPSDLVFVRSRVLEGLTYCFVPVFKQQAPYLCDIDPLDSKSGTEAVLDYLLERPQTPPHTYRRVVMQILGHGRLKLNDGPIISNVWSVLQEHGKRKNVTPTSALERIELRVFSPRAVLSFLEIFVREHEQLEWFVQHAVGSAAVSPGVDLCRGLVGRSSLIQRVFENARRIAVLDSVVLICGPRGSGKHEMAKYMHAHSQRSYRSFVRINCSESTRPSFERDLFGYVGVGRTGSPRKWPGQLELVADGTLYLEEITELADNLQAKILRILEEGYYLPIGASKAQKLSARIMISTSRDLSLEVRDGRLREELSYQISGVRLDVPDLTQRAEDIPELVTSITAASAIEMHEPAKEWAPEVMTALMDYHWPGNIDELQQMIISLLSVVTEKTITLEHVRLYAPAPIASHLCTTEGTGKSLRNLRPAQFWYEYITVYKSRGKNMASAYGVTAAAISQHKTKHKNFRPR